jgi:predicted DsbA family dithiol-disulfide isomerase
MGVRGTPAFLVNGVFISGAQPFEVFQQVIEEQLQNADE